MSILEIVLIVVSACLCVVSIGFFIAFKRLKKAFFEAFAKEHWEDN